MTIQEFKIALEISNFCWGIFLIIFFKVSPTIALSIWTKILYSVLNIHQVIICYIISWKINYYLLKKADEAASAAVDAESPVLESSVSEAKVIDSAEAYTLCSELMQWLEVQADARPEDLVFVQRVKELASSSQAKKTAQVDMETNAATNNEENFNSRLESGSGSLNDLHINNNNNNNTGVGINNVGVYVLKEYFWWNISFKLNMICNNFL